MTRGISHNADAEKGITIEHNLHQGSDVRINGNENKKNGRLFVLLCSMRGLIFGRLKVCKIFNNIAKINECPECSRF